MLEKWKPVVGYEGLYEVSNHGRVRSLPRRVKRGDGWYPVKGRVRKRSADAIGRYIVGLSSDGESRSYYVHRLVLEAFVGPCPEGKECCHFPDRDPSNNRLENLRWDTPKANQGDRAIHGTANIGDMNPRSKLTELDVRWLKSYYQSGDWSYKELAAFFRVSVGCVNDIVSGRCWADATVLPVGTY